MQFGFRCGKSTVLALDVLVKFLIEVFEDKCFARLILCDLTKAFDCVVHELLLSKLKFYGISNVSLKLLESYLSDRQQYVAVNGVNSECKNVVYGVPQGSILGPFLFLIMINDLTLNVPEVPVLYADDTTLKIRHCNSEHLDLLTDESINIVKNWFSVNGFMLNESKTKIMNFSLREISNEFPSVKLLGLELDKTLSWKNHIEVVCRKISRVTFLLRKLRTSVPLNTLRQVYFALFHTHIQYCLHLWGHASNSKEILKCQKRAIRIMLHKKINEPCRPLFVQLKILTVYSLFIYTCLINIHANLETFNLRSDVHNINTRNNLKLDLPKCRLQLTKDSCYYSGIIFYNMLPAIARTVPQRKFKYKIYDFFVKTPLYSIQ